MKAPKQRKMGENTNTPHTVHKKKKKKKKAEDETRTINTTNITITQLSVNYRRNSTGKKFRFVKNISGKESDGVSGGIY